MSNPGTTIQILLVDDSVTDRTRSTGLIRNAKPEWEVRAVADAETALREIETLKPTIVVSDLVMPGMDGRQLLSIIGDDYPGLPVVLITSQGDEQIAAECVSLGAVNYVPKRLFADRLVAVLSEIASSVEESRATAEVMQYVTNNRCSFRISSDMDQIRSLVNFVRERLHATGRFSGAVVRELTAAVREALLNAHFHGNMAVNQVPLQHTRTDYIAVGAQRCTEDPWQHRQIHFDMALSADAIAFHIQDDGAGFDHASVTESPLPPDPELPQGNGLRIIEQAMNSVVWNEPGNELTMTKKTDR